MPASKAALQTFESLLDLDDAAVAAAMQDLQVTQPELAAEVQKLLAAKRLPVGPSATRSWVTRAQPSARSRKRSSPRLTTSAAVPRPARAKSRSGCSQENQRSLARRDPAAIATGSRSRSTSSVAETSLPASARDSALSSSASSVPASRATLILVERVALSRTLSNVA